MSFTEFENSVRVSLNLHLEELKDSISNGTALERDQYLLLVGQIKGTKNSLDLFERTINDYKYGSLTPEKGD